jgi:hypothetical protein
VRRGRLVIAGALLLLPLATFLACASNAGHEVAATTTTMSARNDAWAYTP